jgi:hypothetical protein
LVPEPIYFQPSQEKVRRGVRLFLVPGTLDRVQNHVPPVDAGARLMFTREQRSRRQDCA